jgi:putative heme-binding domain-containing protein
MLGSFLFLFFNIQITAEQVLDTDTGIKLPPGFDAELLYKVPRSQGSWVAMAFDPKGRLVVSDQDDKGVFRVTLADEKNPSVKVESLKDFPYLPINWGRRKVGGALGFIHAFDSLYMSSMKGFYRIRDTDGDDQYDEFTLLKKLGVGYEHSAHSIIKSEDGKALYLVVGNHTSVPVGVRSRQPSVWGMDSLLENMPDAMGHAAGIGPPAGFICRISPDGKDWQMVSSGFRNSVDMAINREGELFTYDSDLEFDVGCPWYRPTRINHVTSGSEFGWRHGTAKWPEYFADGNGSVLDVGPGSPTGMSFGHHSRFPAEYQDKLFICDWTFGTIYTVDMTEDGSSYKGTKKEFLSGTPLNISAMRFGPDGHMYFIVGGRNTASALYRVRSTNTDVKGQVKELKKNQNLRDLRHSLEVFHGDAKAGMTAIDTAWPFLNHEDRNIRYAARIAVENQPLSLWQSKVFSETRPRGVIYAAIALCRHGDKSLSQQVIKKLNNLDFKSLNAEDRTALLRAYSLCFIRLGKPGQASVESVINKLDPFYPATDEKVNTELCRVLCYLDSPLVVAKTIALMKKTHNKTLSYNKEMLERHEYGQIILKSMANSPNVQSIQYAYSLRQVQNGWSLEDRKFYFTWLSDTLTKSGGRSFTGHVRAIRKDAIKYLAKEDSMAISWLLGKVATVDLSQLPNPKGPGVAWTKEVAMKLFKEPLKNRNFKNGEKMFKAGKCIACHRVLGRGGYSGPDLGSVGSRYSIEDILTAIIEPSKTISEQYQASIVTLKNGVSHFGRIIYKNENELVLAPSAFTPGETQKVSAKDVSKVELSNISMMPPGTVFGMNKEELLDLMAYLISGGNKKHKAFKK